IEGASPADRDAQCQHLNCTGKACEAAANPVISVDCKKKELIGQFKNNGREWQARGEETSVNGDDFLSVTDGKAIPYAISDVVHHHGFVNVGIDHETAEFAVESIRRWWQQVGKALYQTRKALLILADSGRSNGSASRLWNSQIQQLATETGLSITVCPLPPATRKWNHSEHRLFSSLSINWRG